MYIKKKKYEILQFAGLVNAASFVLNWSTIKVLDVDPAPGCSNQDVGGAGRPTPPSRGLRPT